MVKYVMTSCEILDSIFFAGQVRSIQWIMQAENNH